MYSPSAKNGERAEQQVEVCPHRCLTEVVDLAVARRRHSNQVAVGGLRAEVGAPEAGDTCADAEERLDADPTDLGGTAVALRLRVGDLGPKSEAEGETDLFYNIDPCLRTFFWAEMD